MIALPSGGGSVRPGSAAAGLEREQREHGSDDHRSGERQPG